MQKNKTRTPATNPNKKQTPSPPRLPPMLRLAAAFITRRHSSPRTWQARTWPRRPLSTTPPLPPDAPSPLHRPLRILLVATLAATGAVVLPNFAAETRGPHAVALLRARTPRLRVAGAARVAAAAASPAGADALVEAGAADALVGLLTDNDADSDTLAGALAAAAALAAHAPGAAALRVAGAAEAALHLPKDMSEEGRADAKALLWRLKGVGEG